MVPGQEKCHEKVGSSINETNIRRLPFFQVTASVVDKPEEQCDLTPQKTCRHKTTLVSYLKYPSHI